MGIRKTVGKALGGFIAKAMSDTVGLTDGTEKFFAMFGGSVASSYNFDTKRQYLKAFNECPPLAATLIRKGQASANGKVWVFKKGTEDEAEGDYATQLRRLFTKPNIIQNWKQFYAQAKIYIGLFGYCPILVTKPAGFTKITKDTQMWCLPPWLVTLEYGSNYLYATKQSDIISKIRFGWRSNSNDLIVDDVIILRDVTPGVTAPFLPESRCNSLILPIQSVVAGMRSNNTIIKRRGGIGILSSNGKDAIGNIPIKPDEKKDVEGKLQSQYGLNGTQAEIIVTQASLTWQPMIFDAKTLMIHETINNASRQICDVHGWNLKLLSDPEGSTFNNVNELKKSVYQDTVIPEAEADFQTFADFFEVIENDIDLCIDYDHIEVLQANGRDEAQGRFYLVQSLERDWRNNMITRNQYLQAIEMETIDGGDVYYYEFIKITGFVDTPPAPVTINDNTQSGNN